jgi:hypothetical protein
MLEQQYPHVMEKLFYGWCFDPSPAPLGGLLACALLLLCSLGETAHILLAAPNSGRPSPKQVRAGGGKRSLATATHHPQTAGEPASMHEHGSRAPRPLGKAGSYLAECPFARSTRHEARGGIGSSFAWSGSANLRPLLINRRLRQKP